jgi:hypothetical protein
MRYVPLFLWGGVTLVLVAIVVSEFAFGKGDAKLLGKRLGLALVWPVAALSRSGRNILFSAGRKL